MPVLNQTKNNQFLAIDVGNTSVSLGVLNGLKLIKDFHLDYNGRVDVLLKDLDRLLKNISRQFPFIKKVAVCSVVPTVNNLVRQSVVKYFKIKALFAGIELIVPIKNNYDLPAQVGQDRLVGAFAAKKLYGYPTIIIDFGTAITFDVVSTQGAYEGGMIIPGIRLSAESLFAKTALLPRIETIKTPRRLVGKNTKESILSGLFYGYGAMSWGLIDMISKSIKVKPKVIVTGGYTHLMKKFIAPKIHKIDRNLVFKGLALLSATKS